MLPRDRNDRLRTFQKRRAHYNRVRALRTGRTIRQFAHAPQSEKRREQVATMILRAHPMTAEDQHMYVRASSFDQFTDRPVDRLVDIAQRGSQASRMVARVPWIVQVPKVVARTVGLRKYR